MGECCMVYIQLYVTCTPTISCTVYYLPKKEGLEAVVIVMSYFTSLIPRPNFRVCPVASSKKRVWTHSLVKLGPNCKAYQHVVAPIGYSRKWIRVYINDTSLQINGQQVTDNVINITDRLMSTGPSFPSESVQTLFFFDNDTCNNLGQKLN